MVLRTIFPLALGALLLWWIAKSVQLDGILLLERFRQTSFALIMLSVSSFVISIVLKVCQLRLLLRRQIPTGYLLGMTLSQNALLTFLPWRLGEAGLPLWLRKNFGVSLQQSVAMILLIRLSDLTIVAGVVILGGVKLNLPVYWLGISVSFVGVVLLLILSRMARTSQLWRPLHIIRDSTLLASNASSVISCAILAALIFVSTSFQSMFAIQAMGLPVTFSDVALLNAASLLIALLPVHPPGGWGTMDSAQVVMLQKLGYEPASALPAILATHGFYTVMILLGGFIGWCLCRKLRRR